MQPRQTEGLSPHERGNPRLRLRDPRRVGTIPARAGEPAGESARAWRRGDYPRTSGGTDTGRRARGPAQGLSPHERGNRASPRANAAGSGTIPARAGEPIRPAGAGRQPGDYPRTSGGTSYIVEWIREVMGLSPHERGNPSSRVHSPGRSRTIPARAGEPWCASSPRARPGDYPRTSGGTASTHRMSDRPTGLSPHERGNRRGARRRGAGGGTIPARAGEPLDGAGGAVDHRGLSPHERGNRTRTGASS